MNEGASKHLGERTRHRGISPHSPAGAREPRNTLGYLLLPEVAIDGLDGNQQKMHAVHCEHHKPTGHSVSRQSLQRRTGGRAGKSAQRTRDGKSSQDLGRPEHVGVRTSSTLLRAQDNQTGNRSPATSALRHRQRMSAGRQDRTPRLHPLPQSKGPLSFPNLTPGY